MKDLTPCLGMCGRRRPLDRGWVCGECEMLILVSGATKTVKRLEGHENLGVLITPQSGNVPPKKMLWAADNAAFSNWDEGKFLRMLERISKLENKPLFVTSPDVVCDAKKTNDLYRKWEPIIRSYGLKVGYVAQNGVESIGTPRGYDALFIGGDDKFKLGGYVRYLVKKAKEHGTWVHMGRVNSYKRLQYAREIGCDSVDGTGMSMFPDKKIPSFLRFLETEQLHLGFSY